MLIAVNHVGLAADDPDNAARDYALVFGHQPQRLVGSDGRPLYRFPLGNVALEITDTAGGRAGLQGVAFAVDDIAATARKLGRRGLGCGALADQRFSITGG